MGRAFLLKSPDQPDAELMSTAAENLPECYLILEMTTEVISSPIQTSRLNSLEH